MDYSDAAADSVSCRWMRGSLIGSGSFGKVHLAVNLDHGDVFAVKSMHSQGQGNPHDFEKEIQILQSLQECPNVVRCMGCLELEGSKMMCMEYMPGGTLTDFSKRFGGKLEESLVRIYCRGILQGMEYFHRKGIVHCDIKASNVLVGSRGEVKVADFGSAKTITTVSAEEKEMSVKGSPLWMAPEVIREEEQGPASDVWSLGCTLLELLTGRPPWTSSSSSTSNPMSALFRIATSSFSAPQLLQHYYSSSSSGDDSLELSEEGKDFLLRCLEMDPKARWSASELLMHPFLSNTTHFSYEKEKEVLPSSPISTLDFHAQYWENSHTSSICTTLIPSSQYSNYLDTTSYHSIVTTTTDDDLIRHHRFSLDDAQDTTSSSSSSSSSSQNFSYPPNRIESTTAEEEKDCSSSRISSSSSSSGGGGGMMNGDKQEWIVVHESPSSSPSSSRTPALKPFCFHEEGRGRGRGRGRGQEVKKEEKACDVGLDLDSFAFLIHKRRRQG